MGSVRQRFSKRMALAIATVGLTALAGACIPQSPTGPATTTTTSTTLPWSEPTGVWTNLNLTCRVVVFGTTYAFPQFASVNVEAPATVAHGETFDMMVAPGPFVVPTSVEGFSLDSMTSLTIRFPLSPNVEFVDSVMSAGINMGPGYPSVTIQGSDLLYRVPGPFAPGAIVQMPKVRLTLTATGAPGSGIETRMTSLSSVANFGISSVPSTCTPDAPNPVFWTTTIN